MDDSLSVDQQESAELSYEQKVSSCTLISHPMADEKTTSKIYKLVKKVSHKKKTHLRIGVKVVQSKLRKGEKGLVIIAGDVYPVDSVCHIPAVCEEKDVPYVFVPSKLDLGASVGTKGGVVVVMALKDDESESLYDKVYKSITKVSSSLYSS